MKVEWLFLARISLRSFIFSIMCIFPGLIIKLIKLITNNKILMINAQQSDSDWSVYLPKYLLGACFINDILSESLEKPGIFSLVDSS